MPRRSSPLFLRSPGHDKSNTTHSLVGLLAGERKHTAGGMAARRRGCVKTALRGILRADRKGKAEHRGHRGAGAAAVQAGSIAAASGSFALTKADQDLRSEISKKRTPWVWLALVTLLAAAMRVPGLDQQLWYDEMVLAVRWMPLGLAELATTYTSQNQHMLYSLLARIAVELFGEQNWVLRLPAMLFGVASVPALYFCARMMQGRVVPTFRDGGIEDDASSVETAQRAARGENGGETPHARREAVEGGGGVDGGLRGRAECKEKEEN